MISSSHRYRFVLAAAALLVVAGPPGSAWADIDKSSGNGYEIWDVSGFEVYDLSDGETLSNILVDQTGPGNTLTIRSRNKSGWTVKNIGFKGVGTDGDGSNSFQFQVSTPSGASGTIENVWMNNKSRNGEDADVLGGIYIRNSHAGKIEIRHTWIEGFGNNAVYGSSVGKDGGNEGTVVIENAYHRDNTVSQFRIGSPDSVVRNSVAIVDDPEGLRGSYPSSDSKNARGIWGKHFRNQRVVNSSFYIDSEDVNHDAAFEARYIPDRSHGPEAVLRVIDCELNADAPSVKDTTDNARVEIENLGNEPTVAVIEDGGVPTSAQMAARGEREMPPQIPGADPLPEDTGTGDAGSDASSGSDAAEGADTGRSGTDTGNDDERRDTSTTPDTGESGGGSGGSYDSGTAADAGSRGASGGSGGCSCASRSTRFPAGAALLLLFAVIGLASRPAGERRRRR